MASGPENSKQGLSLATTNNIDLRTLDMSSPEFKNFIIKLNDTVNRISSIINYKESGIYSIEEVMTNKFWFPNPNLNSITARNPTKRAVFRKTFWYTTPLPNTALVNFAHNIPINNIADSMWQMTDIYGTSLNPVTYQFIPLPYAGANNDAIDIFADQTNIYIRTETNRTAFIYTNITLEYIKN